MCERDCGCVRNRCIVLPTDIVEVFLNTLAITVRFMFK